MLERASVEHISGNFEQAKLAVKDMVFEFLPSSRYGKWHTTFFALSLTLRSTANLEQILGIQLFCLCH
jgi:hypothetical protein